MLDSLSSALISFAVSVVNLFPASPFLFLQNLASDSAMSSILGMLNWFIPVYSFVAIMETWLAGVGLYYVYQIVLRWIKAVG